ncbi:uncharacterized protein LOC122196464 [Lactuca sativa]|uniref:uncharacterized protein LOC122196464 n=1 Tax=Lactuca sativa TaxID=4236 RepID=UPI001C68A979|nr:uncharacterized protein LOC122196464 [Lactuca sativa]
MMLKAAIREMVVCGAPTIVISTVISPPMEAYKLEGFISTLEETGLGGELAGSGTGTTAVGGTVIGLVVQLSYDFAFSEVATFGKSRQRSRYEKERERERGVEELMVTFCASSTSLE